jgi:hypothetical protein
MGKVRFDTKFTLLEYVDGEEIVVCVMGAENSAKPHTNQNEQASKQ